MHRVFKLFWARRSSVPGHNGIDNKTAIVLVRLDLLSQGDSLVGPDPPNCHHYDGAERKSRGVVGWIGMLCVYLVLVLGLEQTPVELLHH